MRAWVSGLCRVASIATCLAAVAVATPSNAAVIIKDPNPPHYKLEIEPHLNLQYFWFDHYNGHGFGPGVRFGIPILAPGFIKKINDSVAISFGADFLRYTGREFCSNEGRGNFVCTSGASYWVLYAPVTMQWNFWLTDKWSVFGEPGLVVRTAFGDACNRAFGCDNRSPIWFAFYAGARFHFSDSVALTLRAGYPNGLSVGVSIF